ncbi:ABC transporter substrate-binding protein [Mesorhizobium sp. CCNWLW179-1]|uniref:ABC transporter substrate-binding protein n=1 Tax=unclassified Mesorhizobium TaxID=325217 RepID=UPI00301543C3
MVRHKRKRRNRRNALSRRGGPGPVKLWEECPMQISRRNLIAGLATMASVSTSRLALAQGNPPGVTDTTIRIGHIGPYSGPASAYGTMGRSLAAYFDKVNAAGGINRRKIEFLSLDDGYNPSKTVEQARKLIEQEKVLFLAGTLGTAQNTAIQKYMNAKKVPQLFLSSGASRFSDHEHFPWTIGWQPTFETEGRIYARHILETMPNAKIAILMQNDDFGRDYLKGIEAGLGDKAATAIVAKQSYEATDPTVDSQIVNLKGSGADVFVIVCSPKFAAQAIKKVADVGWSAQKYLVHVSNSTGAVLNAAGLENSRGIISAAYVRDVSHASESVEPEVQQYLNFLKEFYPGADRSDYVNAMGYSMGMLVEEVLKKAGTNLSRDNILAQATNLTMVLPMLYSGIEFQTASDDYVAIKKMQLIRFNGSSYDKIGGGPIAG